MPSVLVTGASTGIGRACAIEMDQLGWTVFAGVRREEDAVSLAAEGSERLRPLTIDVTDPDSIAVAARSVEEAAGSGGLQGLVNNAGVAIPGPLETLPLDDFRRQLEINLTGQVAVTQALLPLLRRGGGRIVFISSVGGRVALPFAGAYHAAKWGIEAVGDVLRQELRPWGIEVSLVEPGSVATPIWGKGEAEGDRLQERSPAAQEELYGEQLERFRGTVRRTAERGIEPAKVATSVRHALTAKRPRTRYLVGRDAAMQVRLRSLLGARVFDRLVAREMNR
jgi:NAD(P)-dependent dehydrogenase (short-subunit alcohol dehydrogenase family)